MSYRKISQEEARRLQKRVGELERLREKECSSWTSDYPRGVHLGILKLDSWLFSAVKTARRLGHPVVVTHDANDQIWFYAVKEGRAT